LRVGGSFEARNLLQVSCTRSFHEVEKAQWLALDRIPVNEGSRKKVRLLGRGYGQGSRYNGRGSRGFYQRAGNRLPARFEAGTPLLRKLPKSWRKIDRGKPRYRPINFTQIQWLIDAGKLDPREKITMKTLYDIGQYSTNLDRFPDGLKLCVGPRGLEALRTKIDIELPMASYLAAKRVLELGGKLRLVYYNKLGVRVLLRPERWTRRNLPLPKHAAPKPKQAYFYTERDENGLPYKPVSSAEDVIYIHPKVALHKGLFLKSIRERLEGKTLEGEAEFEERLRRAEEQWLKDIERRETDVTKTDTSAAKAKPDSDKAAVTEMPRAADITDSEEKEAASETAPKAKPKAEKRPRSTAAKKSSPEAQVEGGPRSGASGIEAADGETTDKSDKTRARKGKKRPEEKGPEEKGPEES